MLIFSTIRYFNYEVYSLVFLLFARSLFWWQWRTAVLESIDSFCSLVFDQTEGSEVWCTYVSNWLWSCCIVLFTGIIELFCHFWPFLAWSMFYQIDIHLCLLDSQFYLLGMSVSVLYILWVQVFLRAMFVLAENGCIDKHTHTRQYVSFTWRVNTIYI